MNLRKKTLLFVSFFAVAAVLSLPVLIQGPGQAMAHVYDPMTASPQKPSSQRPFPEGQRPEASAVTTPVLLYHYIEPLSPANRKDPLRADFTTTPEAFEAHLKYLKDNNYVGIDLYQVYDSLTKGTPLPPKSVVITFDDGDISQYTYAFPLMKKYGFTGTIFIITQFTDEGRQGYMNWDQALEMARAGWRLEPHTKWHPSLRGNAREYQREQISGSAEALRQRLGYMPRFFSYPYGEYDNTSIAVARETGLWGAVTTTPGDKQNHLSIYELPRTELFSSTTQQLFKKLLDMRKPSLL